MSKLKINSMFSKESWIELRENVNKLVYPILLALIGVIQYNHNIKIQENERKSNSERNKIEAEMKILSIVWNDLQGVQSQPRDKAFKFVEEYLKNSKYKSDDTCSPLNVAIEALSNTQSTIASLKLETINRLETKSSSVIDSNLITKGIDKVLNEINGSSSFILSKTKVFIQYNNSLFKDSIKSIASFLSNKYIVPGQEFLPDLKFENSIRYYNSIDSNMAIILRNELIRQFNIKCRLEKVKSNSKNVLELWLHFENTPKMVKVPTPNNSSIEVGGW